MQTDLAAPEEDSLDEFVRELTHCQVDLFYLIRTLSGDFDAASDIRQAVNIVLWKKRSEFTLGSSFRNWAFQVARFEVKHYLRTRSRSRVVAFDEALLDLFATEFPAVVDELPERRRALTDCLSQVTEKDSELIRHRYWSSQSLEDLARSTNRSVGTLKARLHQLRASLKRCIESKLQPELP
ncbi:sigma-70 family RNA polymerase sigma factor [Luteolibacter sp. LG18]|uniref:sigma-70 family RNA polymerase sigma factor n=1 Tax=Luteolibacter sp. LG18 TaxID=2819286 RepID=UPI002B3084A5|nr:hypothetical protein llg_29410 [Luteolibacter sp. LG18]